MKRSVHAGGSGQHVHWPDVAVDTIWQWGASVVWRASSTDSLRTGGSVLAASVSPCRGELRPRPCGSPSTRLRARSRNSGRARLISGASAYSQELNQPKQTQKESEHVARFSILNGCKVNAFWAI